MIDASAPGSLFVAQWAVRNKKTAEVLRKIIERFLESGKSKLEIQIVVCDSDRIRELEREVKRLKAPRGASEEK